MPDLSVLLNEARKHAGQGETQAARAKYLQILETNETHREALIELGAIALKDGNRQAARLLFSKVLQNFPEDLTSCVTLGNMALEEGDPDGAKNSYEQALKRDPDCIQARQGYVRALNRLGQATEEDWEAAFRGNAVMPRQYRGAGKAIEVLYLASAKGGNVRLWPWLDDNAVAVTVVYADYLEPKICLPPYDFVVDAIGDPDRSEAALKAAAALLLKTAKPVINDPNAVLRTGREKMAELCAAIPGFLSSSPSLMLKKKILTEALAFPLLLRSPGYHTGEHFEFVGTSNELTSAVSALPGDALYLMNYLDTRDRDGMHRKYRVMFIGGKIYPWHLAISSHWKVHYFNSAMAENADFRAEEKKFLTDPEGVLGHRNWLALCQLQERMGLDFAGVDFGISASGDVFVFEANATMTLNAAPAESIWDYRRSAIQDAQNATKNLFSAMMPQGQNI